MTTETIRPDRPMILESQSELDRMKSGLLSPWPRISLRSLFVFLGLLLLVSWGLNGTNVDLVELVQGGDNIADFIFRLFPPEFEWAALPLVTPAVSFLGLSVPSVGYPNITIPYPQLIEDIIVTIQMALIGTLGAIILAIPFGLLAARNTSPHRYVYQGTRLLLNANRALPELMYALIFVAAVGLGPFGGVMALAIGAMGSTGKLYAEAIESIDPQQVLAVRATGSSNLLTFIYSVLPQALPVMASWSLLLFESNIRAASILGLVGAGGIGFTLNKYFALFQYNRVLGLIILLIITVTIIDRISDNLRKRII